MSRLRRARSAEVDRAFQRDLTQVMLLSHDDGRWLLYHWHVGRFDWPVVLVWDARGDTLLEVAEPPR